MKLLSASQIGEADRFTIANEPIESIDLMERAALKLLNKLLDQKELVRPYTLNNEEGEIKVFCGIGNNGGDGLVIARYLQLKGYRVAVYLIKYSEKLSNDCLLNLKAYPSDINEVLSADEIPEILEQDLIIDAIFGSGLSRPVSGFTKEIIQSINISEAKVIAVDVPSGLMADDNRGNDFEAIVKADVTYTFQLPKKTYLFPSYAVFTGYWETLDIGLIEEGINKQTSNYHLVNEEFAKSIFQQRATFSHKGTFGHALIVGGIKGKMGAVVLATKACLKSGVGLVTAHVPQIGLNILQSTVPEAMTATNEGKNYLEPTIEGATKDAIGFGIGAGMAKETANTLKLLIQNSKVPLVIDADGINILAENKTWLAFLPNQTILTPHPGEFKRLVGTWETDEEKIDLLKVFCHKNNVILVLKGAYTITCTPGGNLFFNLTGNHGMATAGSGDTLLGIITALRAQNYTAINAAILGVYLHGLSGDIASNNIGFEALTASDLSENLGAAFQSLY